MWAAQAVGTRRAAKAAFQSPHLQHVVALRQALAAKQRPPPSTNQMHEAPRRLRLLAPTTTITRLPATTTLARLRRLVGMVARRSVARYLCDGVDYYLRRRHAARRLQRAYRRHRQCRHEHGATSFQRLYRGHQGRRVAVLHCRMRDKLLAVVWRHVLHRRRTKHQQVYAAMTLARAWRRYITHRRTSAAIVLQTMLRRSQRRRARDARNLRWRLAWAPFQALYRRHVASTRFQRVRRGVVALQRLVRCLPAVPEAPNIILSQRCDAAIIMVTTEPPPVKGNAESSTPRTTIDVPHTHNEQDKAMSNSNNDNLCNGTNATPQLASGPEPPCDDADDLEEDSLPTTSMAFAAPSTHLWPANANTTQPKHTDVPPLCLSRLTSTAPVAVADASSRAFPHATAATSQATVGPTRPAPPKTTLHLQRAAPSRHVATKHARTTAITSHDQPVFKQPVDTSIHESTPTPANCLVVAMRQLVARRRRRRHRVARLIQSYVRRWLAFLAVQHLRLHANQRLRAALAAEMDAESIGPHDNVRAPTPAPPSLYALNRHQLPFGCVYRTPPPLWTWSHGKWHSSIEFEGSS